MLSVGIITYNEERRLERTLKALKNIADEIIIVDSFSTDKTIEIAKKYTDKVYQRAWSGYGDQKNYVIELCQYDWVLVVDADEVVTPEVEKEILNIIETENTHNKKVFDIRLEAICFGKHIKYGGWGNTYHTKLFKKGSGKFSDHKVHEIYITDEQIYRLKNGIDHYTYETYSDYFTKFNRYTDEAAEEAFLKGKKAGFFNIVLNPIFKFIKMYFFRLGILDGLEGFVLSYASAMYTCIKYAKLRYLQKNK